MTHEQLLDEMDMEDGLLEEPDFSVAAEEPEDEDTADGEQEPGGEVENDLAVQSFPEVTKRFEPIPHRFFDDPPAYYKAALKDEPEIAARVHTLLQKYITATDPKDRSVYRPQIISAYWEFLRGVAKKAPGNLPEAKKYLLRFNLLHPNFIKPETKGFFAKLVAANELNQPIYYLDEWFKAVGTGQVSASSTDEVRVAQGNTKMKLQQLAERAGGKLEGARALLLAKTHQRRELEAGMMAHIKTATAHYPAERLPGVSQGYNDGQRRAFLDVQEHIKELLKCDRELAVLFRDHDQAHSDLSSLRTKIEASGSGDAVLDLQSVDTEFDTIRQTAKMTVGRQGNHYPILVNEYFHCGPNNVAFRENIIEMLARIESIDPEVFCRTYKNKLNRIVPYVVLIPSYGDSGMCWEPFDKRNRATSRGRIFIPMYPKNLYAAVLSAVADLRWQVAKEKASYYWMEEGMTGYYYQWFLSQKLKGDIKEFFVKDYILWMTKEANGVQAVDKAVRGAFWRHIPFSQEVKEKLRNRSYVYQELYQRDLNRAMSDGY
ncbi:MAG: hypothetical protein FWD94_03780 [Treponema sp.]|nr:hypothetical protein [Treponema sp.]